MVNLRWMVVRRKRWGGEEDGFDDEDMDTSDEWHGGDNGEDDEENNDGEDDA